MFFKQHQRKIASSPLYECLAKKKKRKETEKETEKQNKTKQKNMIYPLFKGMLNSSLCIGK